MDGLRHGPAREADLDARAAGGRVGLRVVQAVRLVDGRQQVRHHMPVRVDVELGQDGPRAHVLHKGEERLVLAALAVDLEEGHVGADEPPVALRVKVVVVEGGLS